MSRIPITKINNLYCHMDMPDAEPLSPEEVLDALDGARYLLKMALPAIPEDDGLDNTIHMMISDLCEISDRMYDQIYGGDGE